MITNKGSTQTSIYNNNRKYDINKIEWDASYDGKIAKVNVDLDENGNKKHVNMSLNNEDLAELLNIPSVNEDLHKRIKNDFKNISIKSYKNSDFYFPSKKNKSQKLIKPLFIELDKNNFPGKNNIDDITVFDKDIIIKDYDYTAKSFSKNRLNKHSRKHNRKHDKKYNKKNRTPKTLRLKFNKKNETYI